MESHKRDIDFLNDDKFIEWRLFRTEEMEQHWSHYAEKHPESLDAMNEAIRKFKAVKLNGRKLPQATQDMLFKRIVDNVGSYKIRKRKIRYYYFAAASIVLLIVSSLVFFHNSHSSLPDTLVADTFIGQVMPENEIRLISGEKSISLKKNARIIVGADGKASITGDVDDIEMELTGNVTNRLIVPPGKRSGLYLPDGTKIWLNSGTEIGFPSTFAGNIREISVKGEIYIEVAKASGMPFYVNTDWFRVMVLGTAFNISTYPEDIEKSIVLVDGSVMVDAANHEKISLLPGEMLLMDAGQFRKTNVDVTAHISWKDNILTFNDTFVLNVLKQIGRHYNVRFEEHVDGWLSDKTCTGKLFLSEDFDEIMTSLSVLTATTYYKKDGMIYIKDK